MADKSEGKVIELGKITPQEVMKLLGVDIIRANELLALERDEFESDLQAIRGKPNK